MINRIRGVFTTTLNCFKIPELQHRIIFTVAVLFVVRLISLIPVPGLDGALLTEFLMRNSVRRAPSNPGTGISDIKRTTKRTATVKMILCWSSGILKQFKVVVKTPLMRLIMKLN